MYYTIHSDDTHEPLGFGGPLSRAKALDVIGARKRGPDGKPFSASEWYVTAWDECENADDVIVFQMGADEFMYCKGVV